MEATKRRKVEALTSQVTQLVQELGQEIKDDDYERPSTEVLEERVMTLEGRLDRTRRKLERFGLIQDGEVDLDALEEFVGEFWQLLQEHNFACKQLIRYKQRCEELEQQAQLA